MLRLSALEEVSEAGPTEHVGNLGYTVIGCCRGDGDGADGTDSAGVALGDVAEPDVVGALDSSLRTLDRP